MEEFRILEYNPSLAAEVAEMWNKSAAGWNGMNTARTAEMVIQEHNNAHHLNVFLAMNGCGEVIGYCSLDRYTQDESALYINLLNVRPDYHGKKVGKMLVLACVNKTVELGWPRVDLYTWPGNTKAVPLYKKCGFFWEKRDETTHLMNYIPTVLKTEAIQGFFQDANWYDDSKRIIEVKPDGRKENGFDYFEYSWEYDGKFLRVEFERTGRGIRLVETDDYRISAAVENHELVFGRDYEITYSIINKSGKPLKVALNGKSDKNITFAMKQAVDVTDSITLTGKFHVSAVTEDQKPGRTHPGVVTELFINGRKAMFKTGILPAYPANILLHTVGHHCYLYKESSCIVELENKFREKADFSFSMNDMEGVHFPKPEHCIALKPGERTTVDIPYVLDKFLFYSTGLNVTAKLEDGTLVSFTKRLYKAFRGHTGILWGEGEDYCQIINGPYMVHLNKDNNSMWSARFYGDQYNPFWSFPKVGHPFSSELSDKKTDRIECFREDDTAVMKAVYTLNDFPGLQLSVITRLENSGIVKHYYEAENLSDTETAQEVWLSDTFRQDLFRGVVPYDNRFIGVGADTEWSPLFWDSSKITENWFFSRGDHTTRGVCWDPAQHIQFDGWCMFFEYGLGRIPPGGKIQTKAVTVAVGVFDRWQDFRAYALKEDIAEAPTAIRHTSLEINGGNPFVTDDFEITLKEYRNTGSDPVVSVTPTSGKNPDIIRAEVENGSFLKEVQSVIFRKSSAAITTGIETIEGKKVFWVNNGILSMRACPDFSYALYSLQFSGNEWFDSSFPVPAIKAWWNPWFGGITVYFGGLSPNTLLEEAREACFVALPDQFGNTWQGIKMSVHVSKNEKYRGLCLDSYYLTLPGVPALCSVVRIGQNTGRHLPWQAMENGIFLRSDSDISSNRLRFITKDGEKLCMVAGKNQYFITTFEPVLFESPNRKEKLLIYTDTDNQMLEAGVNSSLLMSFSVIRRDMKNGQSITVPPTFLIFTEESFNSAMLQGLRNIQFNFEGESHGDH